MYDVQFGALHPYNRYQVPCTGMPVPEIPASCGFFAETKDLADFIPD